MSKPTDTWMPLYVGDYLADTAHLSIAEHGAYLLLIMHYWRNGPLPDDDARLARIVRASPDEWAAVRPEVAAMFRIDGGRWVHKRVEAEREKAHKVQSARSAAAAIGNERRWADRKTIANGSQTGSQTISQNDPPSPSPSPSPYLPSPSPSPSQPQKEERVPEARDALPRAGASRGVGKANGHASDAETEARRKAWQAYDLAFQNRYGVPATRNARTNALIAQFCRRVPAEEAPDIVSWYIQSSRSVYVGSRHSLNLLVRDAEAIRTDWMTGDQRTDTAARQVDRRGNMGQIAHTLLEKFSKGESH